jgi:hypothetical protein
MKRFIQGEHRTQSTLLPEVLDDYVTEENNSPPSVIEAITRTPKYWRATKPTSKRLSLKA